MKTNPLRLAIYTLLSAVGVVLFILIAHANNAGQRDFIEYWAAGQQLVHGLNPYDGAAILPLQQAAGLHRNFAQVSFSPPVAFFLVLPLGFVSARIGLLAWLLTLLACVVLSIRLLRTLNGRPKNRLHLFGYCFAPLMECMEAGQLGVILLLGIVLFLSLFKKRPFLAGAALLPCALKPHLFLPFALTLLLWCISRKAYRILAGFSTTLLASCALTLWFDPQVWSQYAQMMRTTGVLQAWVPTLSATLRCLTDSHATWIQFAPEAAACLWALGYFWTRRQCWSWMDHGMLVLLVGAMCTPYAFFTDEAMLLPAILVAIYQARATGRSLLPIAVLMGLALFEVAENFQLSSAYFLWTTPAWLGWYLYATRKTNTAEPAASANQ